MEALSEDRRLKALGLLVGALGVAWMVQLAAQAQRAWPLVASDLGDLAWRTALCVNLCAVALALLARGCGMPSLWRLAPRRRATLLWWGMVNAAVPLFIYGLLDSDNRIDNRMAGSCWYWLQEVVSVALALLLWRMWRRSRRHIAPSASDAMRADPRPPLLYLRSFANDSSAVVDDHGSNAYDRIVGWVGPPSPEEEMARILQRAGPVVAIGRPGEELPQLGAARLYVADDAWQSAVLALMRQAQMVVIRVGASPGLRWEIEQALRRVPRRRIVLAFQGRDARRAAPEVQRWLAPLLGSDWTAALPEAPPRALRDWMWRDPRRRLGSLVCFPEGQAPEVVRLSTWPLWGRDMWPLFAMRLSAPPLLRAWRNVFQRLGIDAGAYVAPRSRVLAVVLATFCGGFGAHWFYLGRRRRGWIYLGLLIFGSFVAGWWDALRFIWYDRAQFDELAPPRPPAATIRP
jgi:hypothetical protein